MNLDSDLKIKFLKELLRIRRFEEKVAEVYPQQQMRCPTHLSIGQEATAVGICQALKKDDLVFGNHRSHGHYIAKGGSLPKLIAEFFGKSGGCAEGIGGSMHLTDLSVGFVASTPIVAGILPVAVGASFATQLKGENRVTVVFLGDGAMEEGVIHECLTFASLKKLPIVFFCENNFFSVYTHLDVRQPRREIFETAKSYNISSELIDGNDVFSVYETSLKAVEHARSGKGPYFIEAKTYRWLEHCGPYDDNHLGYRKSEDVNLWKQKCPIAKVLSELNGKSDDLIAKIEAEIKLELEEAFSFAANSPFPSIEKIFQNLYAEQPKSP